MSFPWNDVLSTGAALFSAAAAGAALVATKRANQTAEAVARIERGRWRVELTPDLEIELRNVEHDDALLNVHLSGPDELGHLDEISITIGDDDAERGQFTQHLGGPTRQDIANHIWGPWRLMPRVDDADVLGRTNVPRALKVGRGRTYTMERTRPGRWMASSQADWQRQYRDHPIRLIIKCRRDDLEWVLVRQVDNPTYE